MPTVLCASNGLICGYIAGIHFYLWTKEASHPASGLGELCYNPPELILMRAISYTYVDNLMIIYM